MGWRQTRRVTYTLEIITKAVLSNYRQGGGPPIQIGSGLSHIIAVAVDPGGNVYVTQYGSDQIAKFAAGSSTPVLIGSGFLSTTGVAVNSAGDIYAADEV